jgi:hypothetical protein
MKEQGWIEPIVERVVGEVLASQMAQLRGEIVRQVSQEIAAQAPSHAPATETANTASSATELPRSVAEIQSGSSQKEILKALLDVSSRHANRVALFVVKGAHATGWQARGFSDNESIKDFALDENATGVSQAIAERVAATVGKDGLDRRFLEAFGLPATGEARLCPLILKDKVAALIYADSGTENGNALDGGAIDLLVLATGAWLEVNSLRKQAQKEPAPATSANDAPAAESHPPAPVAQAAATQAFNDPFAAHSPAFASSKAMAAAAAETAAPSGASAMSADHGQSGDGHSAAATAPASAEDQETHRKAQRFARLLVDEIKLYNQAKVAEGKKNKDLYDRLKDTIEKSQATYLKRYGNTVAASENYFKHEIIRSLAEDDVSILGANFKH